MPHDRPPSIHRGRAAYRQERIARNAAQFQQPTVIPPSFQPTQIQLQRTRRPGGAPTTTEDTYNNSGRHEARDRAARANIISAPSEQERPKKRPIPPSEFENYSPGSENQPITGGATPELTVVEEPTSRPITPANLTPSRLVLSEPESGNRKRLCSGLNSDELRQTNTMLAQSLTAAKEEINALNNEKATLLEENRQRAAEKQEAINKSVQLEKEKKLLRKQIKEMESNFADAKTTSEGRIETLEQQLQTAKSEKEAEYGRAKEEIKKRYMERANKLFDECQQQERKLNAEIAELKCQLEQEKQRPNLADESLNSEVIRLKEEIQVHSKEKEALQNKLAETEKLVEQKCQKIKEQDKVIVSFEEIIEGCKQTTETQHIRLDEKAQELQKIREQLVAFNKDYQQLKTNNAILSSKLAESTKQFNHVFKEYQKSSICANQCHAQNVQNELTKKQNQLETINATLNPADTNARAQPSAAVATIQPNIVPIQYPFAHNAYAYPQQIPMQHQMQLQNSVTTNTFNVYSQ